MDGEKLRQCGKDMVDYVATYWDNIRDRRALADVQPGYLRSLIPNHAPEEPEKWEDVLKDIERVIMPGVTHWHSPHFHAYFPTANSYPGVIADILSAAIGCIGFTWISSPACTELEIVMMDWLGQLLNLPEEFLAGSGRKGGGVIQGSASDATLVALLAAKTRALKQFLKENPDKEVCDGYGKLIAYCSSEAHCSVERAGLLGSVRMRLLPSDVNCSLRGPTFEQAIAEDRAKGYIPFLIVATLGTTSSLAFDNIIELGKIAQKEGIWMHIDAAYAGGAFICPEFRPMLNGVEYADSFNFNPHKWLMVNFDCSAMWVKNSEELSQAFNVDAIYLKHDRAKQEEILDYRHWQIPLGRRFRSLKLWFVLRLLGAQKLREFVRKQVTQAHQFEEYVRNDDSFEITAPVIMGLVCFRLKGSNELNEKLVKSINDSGKIHLISTVVKGVYMLRFAVCSSLTTSEDINYAWEEVTQRANSLKECNGAAK